MRSPVLVAAAIAVMAPERGTAQRPGTVEVAALGVWHNKTTTLDALRGFGVGSRIGVWLPADFEAEAQLDLTLPRNSVAAGRFQLIHLAASLLYNIRLQSGSSVYLRGGYGKLLPQNCVFNGPCSSHGAATGAAGLRIPITPSVLFRSEAMVRSRSTYDYTSFGMSLGVSFLGSSAQPRAAGPDSDSDGVADNRDRCQATPLGALVDSRGCPTDTDGDGVFDGIDRCPATSSGTPVDGFGCPRPPARGSARRLG
jgi:hypothetical protein